MTRATQLGWLAAAGALLASGSPARPDTIVLRGGGELQGKVITDPKKPGTVSVLLMRGKTPLTFQKSQILEVIPKAGPLDTYLEKKQSLGATAESEFDLGLWCEQNQLPDLAKLHFEAAVARDRSFEPAHKKLGHVQHGDQWLSADEVRRLQGLVKFHGQWISEQAKAKKEGSAQASAAQSAWIRRIRILRQALLSGTPDRAREAEGELLVIKEPEAVAPLVKVLGQDDVPTRKLLALVLGGIEGKEATRALVNSILAEPEDDVRGTILERLKERDDKEIVPQLLKALRSESVRVVNRAAWTLGKLGAVMAVPHLVNALISTEERMVMVPPDVEAASATGPVGPGPILMGANQSSLAFMTGPVVGNGVVAYGAVAVPFFGGPQIGNAPLGVPGVASVPTRGPELRAVTFSYQNVEVLAALAGLTSQDFGYDQAAWRRWVKTSFNPNPKPRRQVPQP
jgi:hypothetical protein